MTGVQTCALPISIENTNFPVIVVSPLMLGADVRKVKQYLQLNEQTEDAFLNLLDKDRKSVV